MLYFEKEYFEMYPVSKLFNVTSIFVLDGLNMRLLNKGLYLFSKCRGNGIRYKPPWLRYDKKFMTRHFKALWPEPNLYLDYVLGHFNDSIPDYLSESTDKVITVSDFRKMFYSDYYT